MYRAFKSSEYQQNCKLLQKHPNETVRLVSHGGPCTYIYKWMIGSIFDGLATYILFGAYTLNETDDKD